MAPTAFDGLLLDVGGPLVRLPHELLAEAERSYGLPPGTIRWRGPFDPDSDPMWRDREAGRLSEQAYWTRWAEEVERAAGRTGGVREFIATCYGQPGVDPVRAEAAALVTDARAAGLRVGALSNEAALLFPPDILATLYVLADLDAFVDLSFADVLKPQPEAYRIAVDALDLAAARVLFVDDQPANVAGARAAGREALHFDVTHPRASIQRIRDRLSLAARHPN